MFRFNSKFVLIAPYILGIMWTISHPILSIVTGEFKCRGMFIDEAQLDPIQYSTDSFPEDVKKVFRIDDNVKYNRENFCGVLQATKYHSHSHLKPKKVGQSAPYSSLSCHSHSTFDVVKLEPFRAPTKPIESIVLVIPPIINSTLSDIHFSTLILLERLLSRSWLAKAILVISPHSSTNVENSVEKAVKDFMQAFNGNPAELTIPQLPLPYSRFLIRQLIVLDAQVNITREATKQSRTFFLPQGTRGMVPNLDLVSTAERSFQKYNRGTIHVHPFDIKWWENDYAKKYVLIGDWWQKWSIDFGHFGAFMASMIVGPQRPHSMALVHGIDSMTIKTDFEMVPSISNHPDISMLFQSTEHLLRALNSLNERLHHTVNQYLLPSSKKFVSHGEYIYPVVLLLLPCVFRSISLAFQDIERFDFIGGFKAIIVTVISSLIVLLITTLTDNANVVNSILTCVYFTQIHVMKGVIGFPPSDVNERTQRRQSLQFILCILSIYLHVPIALTHISLAFFSATFWTPLIAFPSYKYEHNKKCDVIWKILGFILLICTWPPTITLLYDISAIYTVYFCTVYIPLHLLTSVLWLC